MIEFFGDEIKRARETAGMTQEQLAKELHCSRSLVAAYETGRRIPDPDTADKLDDVLGANGLFGRMRKRFVSAKSNPSWFVPWLHHEQAATEIGLYEPLVPGLLQTMEYAQALLTDPDRVQARLDRQSVLERATVTVVIEESVLHRQIGDRDTMYGQLLSLAETTACIQVIPLGTTAYVAYDGGLAIATVDSQEVVYLDTALQGFVVSDPVVVLDARRRWLTLRAEALPERHSRDLIMKVATDVWKG